MLFFAERITTLEVSLQSAFNLMSLLIKLKNVQQAPLYFTNQLFCPRANTG